MTVREGPHWVYDACDQGHDYERYGDDIAWEMCAKPRKIKGLQACMW